MTSGTYQAWDGNEYQGDPPEGWYLGADDLWWSPGSGPGPKQPPAAPSNAAPPPAPAPAPPAPTPPAPFMDRYAANRSWKISDDGKNGTVTMEDKGLTRLVKKLVGKDDRQFIPYSSIGFVEHDRKRMGRDVVFVHVGSSKLEWKVQTDAEGFVNAVNERIA